MIPGAKVSLVVSSTTEEMHKKDPWKVPVPGTIGRVRRYCAPCVLVEWPAGSTGAFGIWWIEEKYLIKI